MKRAKAGRLHAIANRILDTEIPEAGVLYAVAAALFFVTAILSLVTSVGERALAILWVALCVTFLALAWRELGRKG